MQKHRRIPPAQLPDFAPVPRRGRVDGWTARRQRDFIAALADIGSVTHAAARVGMSREGAYQLRRQPGAEEFAAAWLAALDCGIRQLEDIALERAIHGVEVPVYSYGKLVGTRIVYNDRLIMFMLRNRAVDRFPAGATTAGIRFHERLSAQAEEAAKNVGPAEMDEIRMSILRKIEAIERAEERRKRRLGIVEVKVSLEGEEAKDFERWRAARAEGRVMILPPEGEAPPDGPPLSTGPASSPASGSAGCPPEARGPAIRSFAED